MSKRIAAVVVVYKNKTDLSACYTNLSNATSIENIVLVDNSYDEVGSCIEYAGISSIDERTHHLVAQGNVGYAAGNNLGIARAKERGAEYVLICNPDVLIGDEAVSSLLAEMTERGLDLISPRLLEEDATGTVKGLSTPGWDGFLGKGVIDMSGMRQDWRYSPTFYGACFLMTTRLFEEVGELSEDFFLYCEEIDYTLRIRETSYAWAISERSFVPHGRGTSISPNSAKSDISFFHSTRSAVVVGRKYWPGRVGFWILARATMAMALAVHGKTSASRAVISGLIAGWSAPLSTA